MVVLGRGKKKNAGRNVLGRGVGWQSIFWSVKRGRYVTSATGPGRK